MDKDDITELCLNMEGAFETYPYNCTLSFLQQDYVLHAEINSDTYLDYAIR